MRTVDLGRTAAQAEIIRIQRLIRRQAMRAVWGAVAAVFLIAVLVMIHVVAYTALVPAVLTPLLGSAVILAFDLVVALIFIAFAMRGAPDPVEAEAKIIRDKALSEMKASLAISAILGPVGRLAFRSAGRKNLWGMTLAALTARFLSSNRR